MAKLIKGINDLQTEYPDIANEWDTLRNKPLIPSQILSKSGKKFWWICSNGHSYEASVDHRTVRQQGCPYCSNRKVLSGYNDLVTIDNNLALQWNYERNRGLTNKFGIDISTPNLVTAISNQKVWWVCDKGHEWQATISSRHAGRGCPYCAGRRAVVGYNDLKSVYPDIAQEWHPTKNGDLMPENVTSCSNKKVWWYLPYDDPETGQHFDFEWDDTIAHRTKCSRGCPYLSGNRIFVGFNDLATLYPNLVKEWDSVKNGELTPFDVTVQSRQKVWWRCNKGHAWQAHVYSRTKGAGCPYCAKEQQSSFPEQAVYYYVKQFFPDAVNGDVSVINMELDIYIPSKNCAIEYDGVVWHKGQSKKELKKNQLCKDHNIMLIRIREDGLCLYNDCINIVRTNVMSLSSLNDCIHQVLLYLGVDVSVNVSVDESYIYETYIHNKKKTSLLMLCPEIASQWHPVRNGKLTPDKVTSHSTKNVWWLGKCGHEWKEAIYARVNNESGCPICSNHRFLKGFNDLSTMNPDLAKQWHPTKNGDLAPSDVMAGGTSYYWWQCDKGHEWRARMSDRLHGRNCPVCAGKQLLVGYNDLGTKYPDLAVEWHSTKNGDLSVFDVAPGSHRSVWWLGKCGHEWESEVKTRALQGCGCPYCSGNKLLVGFNDLATTHPDLLLEWNYDKNENLKPTAVMCGMHRKVWWKCKNGHEWQAYVYSRARGSGCPVCNSRVSSKKVLCIDIGQTFDSIQSASLSLDIAASSISQCVDGKRKTAGGYHWKYVDEDE